MDQASVEGVLAEVTERARSAFRESLSSIVLYGSAAENRLRPVSDVNILFVLKSYDVNVATPFAGTLRGAGAAIRLAPMFILESELPDAIDAFTVKFADVLRRRRVLYGHDPFTDVTIDRSAQIRRLLQVLANLTLRLRCEITAHADQSSALTSLIASFAGPLRSAAVSLRDVRGEATIAPREALAAVARSFDPESADGFLACITDARAERPVAHAEALRTAVGLMNLAREMHRSVRVAAGPVR